MHAGRLDRRVTIEEPQETGKTDSGQPIIQWLPVRTVWARKEPLRGIEPFLSDQVAAKIDTKWTIRWFAGITTEQRIKDTGDDDRLYDITEVIEIGRREGAQILARARAEVV